MTGATYGIIKWLQRRNYSQADITCIVYRYGVLNNIKDVKNQSYMDVVSEFIQSNEDGFQFFTSWVKTYEEEKKERAQSKPRKHRTHGDRKYIKKLDK